MSALSDGLLIAGCAAAVLVPSFALAFVVGRAVAGKDGGFLTVIVGAVVFIMSAVGIAYLVVYAMCSGLRGI